MAEFVKVKAEGLTPLREMNPMLMSYNVEFAEVTGGTFWKAYTPEQIAGTEEFKVEASGGDYFHVQGSDAGLSAHRPL